MHGPTGIFWANLRPFSLQALMGFKDLAQLVQDAETDIGRLHGGVQARSRSCLIRSDYQPGRLPHGGCSARRREC
jgi:hypothetical protein